MADNILNAMKNFADDHADALIRTLASPDLEHRAIARVLGTDDLGVVLAVEALGLDATTAGLLAMVPAVAVAWADGRTRRPGRAYLEEVARLQDMPYGSPSDRLLGEWLAQKPAPEWFAAAVRTLSGLLRSLPADERRALETDIMTWCDGVARVSRGLLGLGAPVSRRERLVIQELSAQLVPPAVAA